MLTIDHLTHAFGDKTVIENLCFSHAQKEGTIALVGPSGCGKTTLLSLIADSAKIRQGKIRHDYQKIAVAFQEPRLIPWLNLEENLNFVLSERKINSEFVEELLRKLELTQCQKTPAEALSGGERQRASLLRALAFGGDLLLLDEPFTALDPARKDNVCDLIRIAAEQALVIVTAHDEEDIACLGAEVLYTVGTPITSLKKDH